MAMPNTAYRTRWIKWIALAALLPALLFAAYLAFVLNWSYSDGERAGYLQKFSRKGWICKGYVTLKYWFILTSDESTG